MKHSALLVFGSIGVVLGLGLWRLAWPLALPCLQLGVNLLVAFVGMHFHWPALTGKRRDGRLPLPLLLFWLPYIVMSWLISRFVVRQVHNTLAPSEVAPRIYVGGYLGLMGQPPEGFSTANLAVIDVTCELPRARCLQSDPSVQYLTVPAWDGTPPTVPQLDMAVQWAAAQYRAGHRVLVHCAFGIGRSATVASALLVALGLAPTWRDAFARIKAARPGVRLNQLYREALDQWMHMRASASREAPGTDPSGGAVSAPAAAAALAAARATRVAAR